MSPRRRYSGVVAGLAFVAGSFLSHPGVASAEPRPEAPGDPEIERRLEFIEQALSEDGPAARRWVWGWTSGYGALAVGQGVAALVMDDPVRRRVQAVGAVSATLGFTARLIAPFAPADADRDLALIPEATAEQRAHKLAVAERLLKKSARAERIMRSPWPRLAALAVTGSSALTLWLAIDRPERALLTMGAGAAIAEAQFQTAPEGALRAWAQYRVGDFSAPEPPRVTWRFRTFGVGGMVTATF